jgi:membrane protein required for colicin V production
MNVYDVVILGCILLFAVKGYFHGFVNELFSLLIIAAGLILSFLFCRPVAGVLSGFVENKDLALILSFVGIFVLTALVLLVLRNTLLNVIERVNMSDADAILGTVVGAFKGAVLAGLVSMFLKHHKVLHLDRVIGASLVFPPLERLVASLLPILPDRVLQVVRRVLGA